MQLNSLRTPFLASLSFGTLLCAVASQAPAAPKAGEAAGGSTDTTGLPAFLLHVPGGTVEMGLEFSQVFDAVCQVANPRSPKDAPKRAAEIVLKGLKVSARTMGRKKVEVPGFFLAKWPVKNSEYEVIVNQLRGTPMAIKPPLHWWTIGQKDDLEKRRPDIDKAYPKQADAVITYWEKNFAELPFALKDEKGGSIADLPVTFVSWRDANTFAGYLGMRLPTEAELTRASRGDSSNLWPSDKPDGGAAYSEDLLKQLKIAELRDQVLKAVGAGSTGPFGHLDMHGQVWQLVGSLGFRSISGDELFGIEWKKLAKDKVAGQVIEPPEWRDDRVIAKGGAFNAANAPLQLLIDARRAVSPGDVSEAMGFRLAKSSKPGYDLLYSLLQGTHNKTWFQEEQETDLTAQFGAERYELADSGFPTSYRGISFAPVNWMSKDKSIELSKLLERSQSSPVLIGTLGLTEASLEPAAPRGIYSLLYRRAGVPKELADALKQGHKALTAKKKENEKVDQNEDDKKKKWRDITSRFGLTDEDIASKEAADGTLKFVRIDGVQIPIEHDAMLLFGNDGKVVGHVKTTQGKAVGAAIASELSMVADPNGKTLAKLHFTVPVLQGAKKFAEFHLQMTLDTPAPAADKPWRESQAPAK